MPEFFTDFFSTASLPELLLIFFAKIIEVAIATLRVILMSKGYRKHAAFISFFEVMIWVYIVSIVISGITEAPIKVIVYSLACAVGVYLGSLLEGHIALGRVLIQAIVKKEHSDVLTDGLRKQGYGVTTVAAHGRDSEKTVLMIYAKRKGKEEIINDIQKLDNTVMIISHDVSTLHGGTYRKSGTGHGFPVKTMDTLRKLVMK